jgi:hypothetical protein
MSTVVVKLSVCDEISDFNAVVRRNVLRSFSRENLFNENGSLLRRYINPIEISSDGSSSRRLSSFRWRVY